MPDPLGINSVRPGQPVDSIPKPAPTGPTVGPDGKSFKDTLLDSLDQVNRLQQEAEGLKGQRSRAEDTGLEIMEQVSRVEANVAALSNSLQKMEAEWRREQERLQAEAERYRKIIAELRQNRQAQVEGIDPAEVKTYEAIKRQKGKAVARLERGTCRACGITLSTAQLQQAKGNQLLRCSNCGRILFLA